MHRLRGWLRGLFYDVNRRDAGAQMP